MEHLLDHFCFWGVGQTCFLVLLPLLGCLEPSSSHSCSEAVPDRFCKLFLGSSRPPAHFSQTIWGFPKNKGTILGGPLDKDYSILGSMLGSPYLGKLPFGPFISRLLDTFSHHAGQRLGRSTKLFR